MLEIREQILSLFRERKKLIVSEENALVQESIECNEGEFIYTGIRILNKTEEFRFSLSPKQALAKICEYYRRKGNIHPEPGYKQIYEYMVNHL